ncbi:MAG: SUMF1/EgtB/PvdO family nonheme iron enzyme [Xenococcaceae cyanobacterium MO_188.B29]|nr:SUMF1/EgtB/PvdO family nonheme iron enzyme [Xenococcaceae cyanobacterium MO_188.B29]
MVESSKFDVFLCHNSQDKPEVIGIAQQLRQRKLKPWLDVWELPPGRSWRKLLEQQIEQIDSVAVFVGGSGFGPWQEHEIDAFLREFVKRGCPVIPVLLESAPEKPQLPIFLRAMTWVDFKSPYSNPMEQLIWGITGEKPSAQISEKEAEAEGVKQQPKIPTIQRKPNPEPIRINRKQFLKWAGLGGGGLVTAVLAREIFKEQPDGSKIPLQTFELETVTVDEKGEVVDNRNKQAEFFKEDLGSGVTLDLVYIPGGQFLMGTEDEEIDRLVEKFDRDWFRSEKPQHEVTVKPFFIGKYPVTQAQWRAIASLPKVEHDLDPDPSSFKGDNHPVEQVSWDEAVEFCQRLSQQTGKGYRLPSEAEWEYACRAGTTTPFHFGETITTDLANYEGNYTYANEPKGQYREETTPVGSFSPNAFGLYDMHGNVWEWCEDNWHDNYNGASADGSAWRSGSDNLKVLRGGSWFYYPVNCRSAYRVDPPRVTRNSDGGFRVVCVASRTTR